MIEAPPTRPRRRGVGIELATAAMFVGLITVAAIGFPPLREAIADGARGIVSGIFPASWEGYYLEIDEVSSSEDAGGQLLFTSGTFPGRPARVIDPPFWPGRWSPSGEQFAFTSGSRLLIADRRGEVRSLGVLLDLMPAGSPMWVQEHELILTMTRSPSGTTGRSSGWWFVRVDPRTGQLIDQRALPEHLRLESASKDGRWALAWDERTASDPSGAALVLHELGTDREIAPRQGEGFAGWAADGRLLIRSERGHSWRLEARDPEATAGEVLAEFRGPFGLPVFAHGTRIAVVELQEARPDSPRAIWLIEEGGSATRLADGLGAVYFATPSRDGRYVAFSEELSRSGGSLRLRTGVIEVASKRVTYACNEGCAILDVR
jgi:hypothetical protein